MQGYNAQVAVDEEAQIIVAQTLTNQPPDVEHLVPMLERVRENCGAMPLTTTADAGYFSEANVLAAQAMCTDPHIATGRRKHDEPAPKVRGRTPSSLTIKERMAASCVRSKAARPTRRGSGSWSRCLGRSKLRGQTNVAFRNSGTPQLLVRLETRPFRPKTLQLRRNSNALKTAHHRVILQQSANCDVIGDRSDPLHKRSKRYQLGTGSVPDGAVRRRIRRIVCRSLESGP